MPGELKHEAEEIAGKPEERRVEVVSRFDEPKDCANLLYAPLDEKNLTYRKTRCYRFTFKGDASRLEEFIRETLVDSVSHKLSLGVMPALKGFRFYLDYGMKKGVLDLEKEAILNYYRELEREVDFRILELELTTRVYVFGETSRSGKEVSGPFVRDIVNPAIHRWKIHDDRSCA